MVRKHGRTSQQHLSWTCQLWTQTQQCRLVVFATHNGILLGARRCHDIEEGLVTCSVIDARSFDGDVFAAEEENETTA